MKLNVREYCSADRNACEAIFQTNVPRYFRDNELSEYLEFIDTSGCPYFVVTADEEIVGCGGFGIHPGTVVADLCWGMVDARQHRRRLGEFLLFARLHRIVTTTDATSVRLGTSQLTDGFFKKFGFNTQSMKAGGIAEGLDDVQMQIELTDDVRQSIQNTWSNICQSPLGS